MPFMTRWVYRQSVVHVSLIRTLYETALSCCVQGNLRTQMSETVLFGEIRYLEMMVLSLQVGWKTRRNNRGLREVLEIEPPEETKQRTLDVTDLDGRLFPGQTWARDNSRAWCAASPPFGSFHCEADDFGDEQADADAVSASQRGCRATTKAVDTRLGSPICWVLCSCIFPLERGKKNTLGRPRLRRW